MNHIHPKTIMQGTLAIALILATVAFATFNHGLAQPALAQSSTIPQTTLPQTITVVGEGKTRIKPDIARINIGVEVLKQSVKEASDANKAVIETVLKALTEQGIANKDIQTSGFSISAERYGPNGPLPENEVNYRVSNNVSVVIRDLDKVSDVLDAAISAGANNIYGVEFNVDNPQKAHSEARKQAVAHAKAKAEELAALNNLKLGKVISISEVIGNSGFYPSNYFQAAPMQGGGGGGPAIAPGELEVITNLQIVYEIVE